MKYIEGQIFLKSVAEKFRKEMYVKRKIQKKIAAFIMTLVFAVSIPAQGAQAQEIYVNDIVIQELSTAYQTQESDTLSIKPCTTMFNCEITMAFRKEGLVMDFTTACLGTASVVGVKDIKVQQKMWYGWKTVLTSSGAENQNESVFACSLTYEEAIKDKTYRVMCTHYANVDVYEEFENDTGAFKFTY